MGKKLMRACLGAVSLRVFFLFIVFFAPASIFSQERIIKLATTTSTENTGLLDAIVPQFERLTGYQVNIIAVGTGKALKYGAAGDVDCVLVHSESAEIAFVSTGYGVDRKRVMYNDFVIVGSSDDIANIRSLRSASEAMGKIAAAGERIAGSTGNATVLFISRGDESGTHLKEMELWPQNVVFPRRGWYLDAGQGMAQVLIMSSELRAYTLTDRGTFLALQDRVSLNILVEADPRLFNPYSVIAVNPDLHSHVNYRGASEFIQWLTSPGGQELIGNFKVHGKQLFYPDAVGAE